MKTIQFTESVVKKDCRVGTPQEEAYQKDQIATLPDDQALRWVRRNKAVEIQTPEPEPEPMPETEPAAKEEQPQLSKRKGKRKDDKEQEEHAID
jgi:hypothetical protein